MLPGYNWPNILLLELCDQWSHSDLVHNDTWGNGSERTVLLLGSNASSMRIASSGL